MRLSHPLLLASLGVLVAAASCTLITDVDRSKIPDGSAGVPSGGDGTTAPQGGDMNMPTTTGGSAGTAGTGGSAMAPGGAGGTAGAEPGGAGGIDGTTGGTPDAAGTGGKP